ncbi:MAG: hypothetical protein CM15mP80_03800 [Alphaproteobacteria bacterium]|nr:MAG: hypothetical protein CM15mP80_03800 [Alphaproteobacteria bacterium]
MKLTRNISLLTLGLLILGLYSAAFTVNQTQQALVLQFGEPKRIIQSPGLQFKFRLFRMLFTTRAAFCL